MDHFGNKAVDLVEAARRMMKDAGFEECDQFFGRRVTESVLRLAKQFQEENLSAVVGRLVVALFSRIARGCPPTPEFLREVGQEIEKFAKDEPYDEVAEKGRWIHKRYPTLWWAGDLHKEISGMVFPRNEKFAGAPLVRENPDKPSEELLRQIKSLLWDGQRMEAIKAHQGATGEEFDKSKEFIDSLYHCEADDVLPQPKPVRMSEIRALIEKGAIISAIVLYRKATGKGLKESRDFVYELRDKMEPSGFVDDTDGCVIGSPRPPDHYGFGLAKTVPPFAQLDYYGSGLAFAPGKMSGTVGAENVEINTEEIAKAMKAMRIAAQDIPGTTGEPLDAAIEEIEKTEDSMCSNRKVGEIITGFCRNMESFTSLDVSNKAKVEGVVARHREIAELVRAAFADGEMDIYGYVRDMINVTLPGGGSAQAYLYRHTTVPADDYKNRAQVALKPQLQPQPVPVPFTGNNDDDDDSQAVPTPIIPQNLVPPVATLATPTPPFARRLTRVLRRLTRVLNTSSVTRTQKGDGRLEVPHVWLTRLGWQIGDTVSAIRDGNSLILKTNPQPGERVVRSFTVDRWNRIRITTKALNEASIHFGTGGQHIMTLRATDIKID